VVEAFAEAEREGRGVVLVDGRMVEQLHVDTARRVLATARIEARAVARERRPGLTAGRRGPARRRSGRTMEPACATPPGPVEGLR
jgi:hypothetical protein